MPRTAEQYEQIRSKRRRLIMETALDLFATKGYYGTSMNNISQKAGISKGLVYNYFSGKEELLTQLVREGFLELVRFFHPGQAENISRNELRVMINNMFRELENRQNFWKLYFAVMTQPLVSSMMTNAIMELAAPVFQVLTDFFRNEGYKNPEAEARMFSAFLDGISMNFVVDPQSFPLDKVRLRILEMYNL